MKVPEPEEIMRMSDAQLAGVACDLLESYLGPNLTNDECENIMGCTLFVLRELKTRGEVCQPGILHQ